MSLVGEELGPRSHQADRVEDVKAPSAASARILPVLLHHVVEPVRLARTQSRRFSSQRVRLAKPIASQAGCAARTRATGPATAAGSRSRPRGSPSRRSAGAREGLGACGSSPAAPLPCSPRSCPAASRTPSLSSLGRRLGSARRFTRDWPVSAERACRRAAQRGDVDLPACPRRTATLRRGDQPGGLRRWARVCGVERAQDAVAVVGCRGSGPRAPAARVADDVAAGDRAVVAPLADENSKIGGR